MHVQKCFRFQKHAVLSIFIHRCKVQIVHWNSPKKTRTRNPYAVFFRRHFQTFTQMDGNLLRTEMLRCSNELVHITFVLFCE